MKCWTRFPSFALFVTMATCAAAGEEMRPKGGASMLAFSRDGRLLASAADKSPLIHLWEIPACKLKYVCEGHTQRVGGIDFGPDGKTLVSAGWDGCILFWDLATGKEIKDKRIDTDGGNWLTGVRFVAPDAHVVTTEQNGPVRRWEIASRREVSSIPLKLDVWFKPAFSVDGRWLTVVVGPDRRLAVWDVMKGRELLAFAPHKDSAYAAIFSLDKRYIASGGRTNQVHLWEIATGQLLTTLPTSDDILAFSPDGRTLATSSSRGGVHLWDLATGKERRELRTVKGHGVALAFSPDGRPLAVADDTGTIRLIDVKDRS